ncbi:unnamed protein product [Lymnaea stagnalis]|uniref:C2H2-type domain-containing protein n=1 Tax=Lymnaea stagnalis TaxID=6523 RepID=A0AAV2H776_LYMST
MASRRKSARPTIKIRQQREDEDGEACDDNTSETQIIVFPTSKQVNVQYGPGHASNNIVAQNTPLPATSRTMSVTDPPTRYEPHIAIPTDIYQDFEALKSATKLDTPELMRKLLKDYQRISAVSQSSRERRLDHVIGDIVAAKSSSIIDLQSNETNPHFDSHPSDQPRNNCHDDLMVVDGGSDDDDDDVDDMEDDAKPLDLTLHRQEQSGSPDSAIVEDIHTRFHVDSSQCGKASIGMAPHSLMYTPHDISSQEMKVMSTLKGTGPYVINLEPGSDSSLQSSSMLAQALTLDIPAQVFSTQPNKLLTASDPLVGIDGGATNKQPKPTAMTLQLKIDNSNCFNNDRFKNTPLISTLSFNHKSLDLPANLGGLPSYSEALSSVLNSHKVSNKQTQPTQTTSAINGPVDVHTSDTDHQRSAMPLFQINSEDSDIKLTPFNLNSQHMSCGQQQSEQQNSHQQQQPHNSTNLHKEHNPTRHFAQLSKEQQELALKAFCSAHVPPLQMLSLLPPKQETNDTSPLHNFLKSGDAAYPNFLLDPQSMNFPTSSVSTSNVPSNAAMQMPTFFMTTSANGVSNMVAIPVLHTLPDGMTGLQPFAFAPHPVQPPSTSTSVVSNHFSTDMIYTTPNPITGGNLNMVKSANSPTALNPSSHVSPPLPNPTKPKLGRPRGKGGRSQSQRLPNKDMKLVTENTLFPGVYTSILKLPWSRRSRNKTKVKTICELKKQAQIIVQEKLNEKNSNFLGGLVNVNPLDTPDAQSDTERYIIHLRNAKQGSDCIFSETLLDSQQDPSDDQNECQKSVQLQKQKDLEQQQRLHAQYHLRLQEEQRKLTKQIEQSYQGSPESPITAPFAINLHDINSVKQEVLCHDYSLSGSPILAMSATSNVNADQNNRTFNTNYSLSYPTTGDVNIAKKSPKKRGRPPKISSLQTSTDDKMISVVMTSPKIEQEPDNFLNISTAASTSASTSTFSILKSALSQNSPPAFSHGLLPNSPTVPLFENTEDVLDADGDISNDKKTAFLTSKLAMEMSIPLFSTPQSCSSLSPSTNTMEADGEAEEDDQHYSALSNTATLDVKPRRKKVSRLLKSNENFMYATFKIKPKTGSLAPRKTRRKRKDVLASTAAAAETIANLRQKKLQESASGEGSRPSSMVAWKFHEQYPCPNEDVSDQMVVDKKSVCATCGNIFPLENDESIPQVCGLCLYGTNFAGVGKQNGSNTNKLGNGDPELKAECCVTCGKMFQKHYSDTSARCDGCLRNNPTSIKSSKLFSFCDSNVSSYSCATPSSASPPLSSVSCSGASTETLQTKDTPHRELFPARLNNNNHLYCSVCRMEFTKICDYLHHIREVHESKPTTHTWGKVESHDDLMCKVKVSKTKKSLAHKTLTCPVEECPHFFREQKDLSIHLTKKHSNIGICQQADVSISCPPREGLVNNPHQDQDIMPNEDVLASEYTKDSPKQNVHEKSSIALPCGSQKPLQCEFCDYRCRQKNALTWHMRKHPEAASQYRRYSSVSAE